MSGSEADLSESECDRSTFDPDYIPSRTDFDESLEDKNDLATEPVEANFE
jgi:hypothetical protein